jgi:hypothetical protein
MDGKSIKRRTEALISDRRNVEGMWDIIERFIVPYRAMMFQSKNSEGSVDWRRREIFDSTAIQANTNLAAHIHGAMTNSELKWFGFGFQDRKLRERSDSKEWLEEADMITYQSIKQSNFDLESNELYIDLTAFGGGIMTSMPELDDVGALDKTRYRTLPVDECYYETDVNGNIINFFRVIQWTALKIVDKFGKEGLPEVILQAYENPDRVTERFKVIFSIYKRMDIQGANTFTLLPVDSRPYGSKYIFWDDSSEIGEENGHHEMPVFAPQWRRVSGSKHGFSPSMIAIWDVLTLNQLEEMILVAGEKVLDPTLMTTKKGVYGDIDLSAGGTVVVQDIEKSMKAFESRARFDVSSLQRRELIDAINEAYYVNELKLKESPAMTAAEVHARVQLMQRLIGPTFGRLKTHFMDPAVTRQFMINYRYKKFPEPPASIGTASNTNLKIDYLGTLAKSQKMEASSSVERWMGTTLALTERYPDAADIPNIDAIVREQADNEGVPATLLNNEGQVAKTRMQRKKHQAAVQEAMLKQQQGDAAQAVGKGQQEMKGGPDAN